MSLLKDKTVLIVGLGLIGGSIARGLIAARACHRVVAVGRDEAALQAAKLDGNIHAYATDLATLAPEADLIMITVPTLSVRHILEQLDGLVDEHVIITDAASVKGNVVADARQALGAGVRRFVPGHPIAGSERSGYAASRADLFDNRKVILTPLPGNDSLAVRTVMALWQQLGAEMHAMSVERHDQVLAGTSHLPHLLAYTLVNTLVDSVSESDRVQQVFDYAAGGFADFSRIASSDPVMWRDIFLANKDATVDILDAYVEALQHMRTRLLRGDGASLTQEFTRAKRVRDAFFHRFQGAGGELSAFSAGDDACVLTGRAGLSLQGEFRSPASPDTARQYLADAEGRDAVSILQGVPEDLQTLASIQSMRNAGVPVIGPEQGVVTVYGGANEPAADDLGAQVQISPATALPADDLTVLALALAASAVSGSRLLLSQVYAGTGGTEHPLQVLQQMGAKLQLVGSPLAEVVVSTASLQGCELDFRGAASVAQNDAVTQSAATGQVLAYMAAGTLAQGETRLRIDALVDNARILHACRSWQALGADIHWQGDLITVKTSTLLPGAIACRDDPEFALLSIVLAQRASGHVELMGVGGFFARYPGLAEQLQRMGFGLNKVAQ
ncbi:MAG: hypothetical protein CMQ34_11575 [Gammaproteobacteria bacterium]|nr:hypothetical protein [Gammaproteobacteria bacterium]|tara:strand:+ start:3340 stop:5187 length:1848 start_codon:yes stop_codon:yes gene_type:complete